MSERLLTEKQGAVGWIVFNNPQRRNAVEGRRAFMEKRKPVFKGG